MKTTTAQEARLPFHETIVKAIRKANNDECLCLTELIRVTKIPQNHDKIIEVLESKWGALGYWKHLLASVKAILLEQKHEAEAASGKPENLKASALMEAIHRIIVLYQRQHAGNLDEDIFRIFERAKTISFAQDDKQLNAAIAELKK